MGRLDERVRHATRQNQVEKSAAKSATRSGQQVPFFLRRFSPTHKQCNALRLPARMCNAKQSDAMWKEEPKKL